MQHRLMILGSMDEFVELVRTARRRNIYTIVCDGYENGPAKAVADKAFHIDVRKTKEIAALCHQEKVDGIITSFSDLLAECMVQVAAQAGLKSYCTPENMVYLRNKTKMKQMFCDLNIPTPHSVVLSSDFSSQELAPIGMPCVIKPLNGYGSRGVLVAHTEAQIRQHFAEVCAYSNFDCLLAEPYNEGYEFNMMAWVLDGKVCVLSIADREKSNEIKGAVPHVSRIVYPSRMMREVYEPACQIIQKVADFTGIAEGPLSMQFFYTPQQGLQVCEIAGRLFGYEHELLHYAGGLSLEELLLDWVYDSSAMRHRLKEHDPWLKKYSAGLYFHGYEGVVAEISAAQQMSSLKSGEAKVVESTLYYKLGDRIDHKVGSMPYVVRYYITGSDYTSLDKLTAQLYATVSVKDKQKRELLYQNQLPEYIKTV